MLDHIAYEAGQDLAEAPSSAWRARDMSPHGAASMAAPLMLAMPLTGWLQNSAAGFPLTWFGLFKVPALVPRDKAAFALWQQTHEWLAWALMALIALHVLAAAKHHLVDKDDTLRRMLPWRSR